MSKVTITHLDPTHQDDRGCIKDILNSKDAFHHIGLISFAKDAVRANHYHTHSDQYDYITKGSMELATKPADDERAEVTKTVVQEGDLIFIPRNTIHAYRALEEAEMLDITTSSREGEGYEDDTTRVDSIL